MTVREALTVSRLPSLEAEVLLAALLGKERSWLLAHDDAALSSDQELNWNARVTRRRNGEPVAYITGEREFYGRTFRVTPAVLIPRPATEELVRSALAFMDHPQDSLREADAGIVIVSKMLHPERMPRTVVDVGTGSGCIAITLALERPDLTVMATDSSAEALEVARGNARLHGVEDRVEFRLGENVDPVRDMRLPFLLVSNPPYIPQGRILAKEVMDFEPQSALFAGMDGTDVLRAIVRQAQDHPHCVGFIVECGEEQADFLSTRRRRV